MSARASHHGCRPSGRGTSAPRARACACVCSKAASCAERKKDVGHGIVCSSRVCGGCKVRVRGVRRTDRWAMFVKGPAAVVRPLLLAFYLHPASAF